MHAQVDSVDMIKANGPEVYIFSDLSESKKILSNPSDNNIAQVLSRNTALQIQGQGGSYLRTALYRGQAARHMAILWEGVNIQNQFNGTYDLGLIPASLFGNSKWYDGGHSAAIGTAAMSGALVLEQNNKLPTISLGSVFNDQGNRNYNAKLTFANKLINQTLGISIWDNANKYRYQDFNEVRERKNSEHLQNDFTYAARFAWSDHVQTKISYWYQDAERSLPPSIISSTAASQEDTNHRMSLSNIWQITPSVSWSSAFTYMNEYIGYFQPGINSEAQSNIWNLNNRWSREGDIDFTIGLNLRYENGELVDTINPSFDSFYPERMTAALFYNGNTDFGNSDLSFSLRQELIDSDAQIPSLQLEYKYNLSEEVIYSVKLGNYFSYPGFNDLYWPTGGNPDLVTEKSYQLDLGVNFYDFDLSIFVISTDDKILWAPNEQNIWSPENISSTRSLGFDFSYRRMINIDNINLNINPILTYNHTINTADGVNKGNDLLYNPRINARLNFDADYKDLKLLVGQSYTSQRYQSLDNRSSLDAYYILDAEVGYNINYNSKYFGSITLGARNILDQSYELVQFYPQALRSIYLGANISIQ